MENTFRCHCCGECCSGEMHVYLNPEDLHLMAAKNGFNTTNELFDRGIVIIDRERNRAPLPRIRFRTAAVKCCPFLENRIEDDGSLLGLCLLHPDSKPLVCALAPLYRSVDLNVQEEEWGFKRPFPACPGCNSGEAGAELYSEVTDEATLRRLDSEKKFFARLSHLLDEGVSEEDIIEELYYMEITDG